MEKISKEDSNLHSDINESSMIKNKDVELQVIPNDSENHEIEEKYNKEKDNNNDKEYNDSYSKNNNKSYNELDDKTDQIINKKNFNKKKNAIRKLSYHKEMPKIETWRNLLGIKNDSIHIFDKEDYNNNNKNVYNANNKDNKNIYLNNSHAHFDSNSFKLLNLEEDKTNSNNALDIEPQNSEAEALTDYKEIDYNDFQSEKTMTIILLVTNVAIGFFIIGYNLGVLNTMLDTLKIIFEWSEDDESTLVSIVSSILPIGALIGGVCSGFIASTSIGRRGAILGFDILLILGAGICAIGNTASFICGRFIMGLCVGGYSTVVPVYIKEYVPRNKIGKYGVVNFSFFCFGVVCSFVLGLNLEDDTTPKEEIGSWWRFMIFFPCIIAGINFLFLLISFKRDTPSYLCLNQNNREEAKEALEYIYNDSNEIDIILDNLQALNKYLVEKGCLNGVTYSELFSKKYFSRLLMGILLNVGQQFSGINVFTFYSNSIYLKNEPDVNATLYSSFLSFAEVGGNLISIFLIEKVGRKIIFLIGFSTVLTCLILMTIFYYTDSNVGAHKFIVVAYYFFAGMSTDPIIWILSADLLPEIGVGICASVNWISAIIIIVSFPYMMDSESFGLAPSFLIYTICTTVFLGFMTIFLKETKNKSYLQIEQDYSTWL